MAQQQLLDLFNHIYDFKSFIPNGNELTVVNLQNYSSQYTHIYGASLTGKTHLLKAWINAANQKAVQERSVIEFNQQTNTVPAHNAVFISKADLSRNKLCEINLDKYHYIAIDDIDLFNEQEQIELFNLFNHIKLNNRNNYLLTSSTLNLNNSGLRLDLKTRIHSGLVFALKSLDETELLAALAFYAKHEGIKIGSAELKYLLTHYTRNLGKLISLINKASSMALSAKKLITIPLLKTCM